LPLSCRFGSPDAEISRTTAAALNFAHPADSGHDWRSNDETIIMEQTLEQRIRERAYALWQANGCAIGQAEQHWLAAEREVLAILTTQAPAPVPTATRKPRGKAASAAKARAAAR
jgi:hypothetical protein